MDIEPEQSGCTLSLLRLFFGMSLVVTTLIALVVLL